MFPTGEKKSMPGKKDIKLSDAGIENRQAEILFAIAAAKIECRKLGAAIQFTGKLNASQSPAVSQEFTRSLHRVAEAFLGQSWDEIKKNPQAVTPETNDKIRKFIKEIQDILREQGINPRMFFTEKQIIK